MTVECAKCSSYMCRTGSIDVAPVNCPMHGGFPSFADLYADDESRRMAYQSALVEADGYCRWTRVREVAALSRRMGFARVGIAHCADMYREANLVDRFLTGHEIETVLPPRTRHCSPRKQAELFQREDTDFNLIAGMCVGHDAVFIRESHVAVTSLVVRDLRLRHNPVGALYTSRGYLRDALHDTSRRSDPQTFCGTTPERILVAAEQVRTKANRGWCRLEEIMEFANALGARHLGVTFCVGFRAEAESLTEVLRANGFRVSSACCKTGAVPKEVLGIGEQQKVRPNRPEMICNSLAQAELLNREGVELALLLGQCVGHDSATMLRLEAPVVCAAAKDRVLAHNTVAALYELEDQAVG